MKQTGKDYAQNKGRKEREGVQMDDDGPVYSWKVIHVVFNLFQQEEATMR